MVKSATQQLEEMDQATATIRAKADDIFHNFHFLVEVNCDELARLGVLDAYKKLRNKDFKAGATDHITIGQALHIGLIKLPTQP
jgi:hypothetical protein